jgi:dihydrofolate reductase/thymidylate synthase
MSINLISCVAYYKNQFIIGKNNDLLIRLKEDLSYFKSITSNKISETPNVVLMGRKTWFSIPLKFRPLKDRINFVLTNDTSLLKYKKPDFKNITDIKETVYFLNLKTFLDLYTKFKLNVFVIGGSDIYNLFLEPHLSIDLRPKCLYITEVKDYFKYNKYDDNANYTCIKEIPGWYKLTSVSSKMHSETQPGISFRFLKYTFNDTPPEEKIYLNTLKRIIDTGNTRIDRTNVGTVSIFGTQMRFDISQSFPLLTTRFIPLRIIIEELLWFLRGDTDATILQDRNVHIWDGNTSREFLDDRGLGHYKEGILGPGYGFQMRFFGAEYSQMFGDTSNVDTSKIGGFDQLKYILKLLNTDPFSRRIMMSYWNPPDFDKTALIPCFIKDNLILTRKGYKKIQDVENDDILYTHNSNWKPIVNKQHKKYTGNLYHFKLKNNTQTIVCTEEHPFLVKNNYQQSQLFWCDAKNITSDHIMCLPINKKCNLNNSHELLSNKNIWFLFGYFVNDGYLDIFNNCINLHIYGKDNKKSGSDSGTKTGAETESVLLRKKLLSILDEHFLLRKEIGGESDVDVYSHIQSKKSYIIPTYMTVYFEECLKNIPEWIHDGPTEYIFEFLNGFFYSYYYNTQSIKHENSDNLQNTIIYSIQRLYAKVHNDKYITIKPFFKMFTDLNHIIDFDENHIYYPIESITVKTANDVDVYNFEVAGDNSYTVNNVIAHNCHTNVQFYVEEDSLGDQHLSCQFYMRSNDFALANNFNVTSYAILTYILALKCNMKPKEIIFTCGDTHVYKTHIEPIKDQLTRNCRPFPVLLVNDSVKYKDFNKITVDDFELCGYYPHKNIKLDMAI